MAALIYSSFTSLDGYVADREGRFDWSVPDDEVHAYVNESLRRFGIHLYGRKLYETMRVWEDMSLDDEPEVIREFAAYWKASEKVVYSRTLTTVSSARTSIADDFDPDEIQRLKSSADTDLLVGGATLGAEALRAGLVDEIQQFVCPVIVGGGLRFLPEDLELQLELIDSHRFAGGTVSLRYRVLPAS
ncbi:dihydrofolate reductase family protein [soil metagenome]